MKSAISNKKILIISTVGLVYDGITSVLLSYLKAIDRTGLDIYVAGTIEVKPALRKQIEELDCRIIDLPNRRTETKAYALALAKFINKNKIEVVHAHGNSGTLAVEMCAAWLGGCKKRIAHSHNTKCDQVKADRLLRPVFNLFYTDALACGEDAGKWLFKEKRFVILRNGRDVEQFAFNNQLREATRKKLNIHSELAFGHVGGFFEQKNHEFLVEICRSIRKQEPEAKLFMIGDGPLKTEIEKLANDINVVFTGTTDNVSNYLQAMDGMLLPSLFEGLPLVAIEWQINGLPCLLSDTITTECVFTDTVKFLPLDTKAEEWATEIIKMAKKNDRVRNAELAKTKVAEAGFDIKDSALLLKTIYTN